MAKPESYPFLRIAKKYGYDYGDVLQFADLMRRYVLIAPDSHWLARTVAAREIFRANEEFRDIQEGRIDWQTGLPPESTFNRDNVRVDTDDAMDYGDGRERF